eukprot:Skav212186  [mRNA]  locus=scaffold754:513950:514846:- [translate_table: standard]
MVQPRSSCSCSYGWYQQDLDLAPADAWWKEAIRHETENRCYVRQLPGAWAATFGGSQVDSLIKHQVERPSDRSFRPHGRRVVAEPRESDEFKKALVWVDEEQHQGRLEEFRPPSPPPVEPASLELQATEPVTLSATEPVIEPRSSTGGASLPTEDLKDSKVSGTVSCPNCGATVPDANFCLMCGASLRDQFAVKGNAKPRAKSQGSAPGWAAQGLQAPKAPRVPRAPRAKEAKDPKDPKDPKDSMKPRLGSWSLLRQRELNKAEPQPTKSFKPPPRRAPDASGKKPKVRPAACTLLRG